MNEQRAKPLKAKHLKANVMYRVVAGGNGNLSNVWNGAFVMLEKLPDDYESGTYGFGSDLKVVSYYGGKYAIKCVVSNAQGYPHAGKCFGNGLKLRFEEV